MAEFQIKDTDQLYNAAYDMANYSSKVRKAKESAMSVRRNLAYNGAAYNSIRSSIQSIIGSLDEEIESLISVSSGLENIRSNYNSTERSIIENATGVPSNYGSGSPINKDNLDKILASEASKLTTDEINSVLRLLLNQDEKDTEQLIEKMLLLKPGEESVFFGLYKLVNKSDSDATMLPIEDSYAEFAGIFASSALAAFFVQNSSDELKITFGESEFEKDSYIKISGLSHQKLIMVMEMIMVVN
ncbi:hypothetical protein CIY_34110 [Butyrivibrio fibrisolvens 16/4]|nr:hypothetical protein CIY_34110 [Butyrivibrio fibrisolvens 16/4]